MLQKFLYHLKFEKRYSDHTIVSYKTDLEQLEDFLHHEYDSMAIEDTGHGIIRSWVVSLVEAERSPRTINRKVSAVKSYFKWGKKYASFQSDPTQKLVLPKIAKRLPVYVEESNMDELLLGNVFPNTFEGRRDQLIIDLFYQSGIRSSELINIKASDIDFSANQLKVLGKRNKERIIPVGPELISKIKEFIEVQNSTLEQVIDPQLFLTSKGSKLYPKLVYRIVNNYLGEVSAIKKKSPHVLRHSFATHMLGRGADLNAIKELLGHTSLAATQVYTHNSIEKLKEIHRKSHPNG